MPTRKACRCATAASRPIRSPSACATSPTWSKRWPKPIACSSLEFSQVALPLLRDAYDLYSFRIIPRLGEVIARDRGSYQYLVESIRRFPDQDGLAHRMTAAGLSRVQYRNLMGGVAALHSGWRL